MREIEVKILEIDKNKWVKKLEALGAKKTFDDTIEALHFDFPDQRLKKEHKVFRLRKKGNVVELTLKQKINKERMNVAEEYETLVDDFERTRTIIKQLGMEETDSYTKHRTQYSKGDVHVEIDTYDGIPTFAEIEAQTEAEVEAFVKELGYSMDDVKPWSKRDLFRHYKKIENEG